MTAFKDGNIIIGSKKNQRYISINNEDFLLSYLNPDRPFNKGASSNVFILSDPEGEYEDRVIKICKSPVIKKFTDRRLLRFQREIRAFEEVKKRRINGVITYDRSGLTTIDDYQFRYIILEKADGDLASFLENQRFDFTSAQKLNFCVNIINCLRNLHNVGIYHRDIKHDNILVVANELKIGDLGLVTFQDRDYSMDLDNEKIGPAGWLAPEATNKMLTFNKRIGAVYDCDINSKSDVFQLGKLFWYIFQGNLPTGQILPADKRFDDDDVYDVIFSMVQYSKERRPTLDEVARALEPIRRRLFV